MRDFTYFLAGYPVPGWERANIVRLYRASGLSVREYANAHDPRRGTEGDAFLELVVQQPERKPAGGAGLVLTLDAFDARVLVGQDTDLVLLRRVLAALC